MIWLADAAGLFGECLWEILFPVIPCCFLLFLVVSRFSLKLLSETDLPQDPIAVTHCKDY